MENITTYIINYIAQTTGLKLAEADIAKLKQSTEQLGISAGQMGKILGTESTVALQKHGSETKQVVTNVTKARDEFGKMITVVTKNGEVMKVTTASTRGLADNLWTLASRAMLTIPIWLALRSGIMGIIGGFQAAGKFLVELEDAMIEIRMVGGATDTELTYLKESVLALGAAYGVTAKDSLEAAKIFIQQGLSVAETTDMVRASMIASQLLGFSVSEAAENLTAAMRAYKIETEDAIGVVDKWMAVQKKFAVTAKDLSEATKTAAATAAGFGIEYEQYLGHITAIIEVTRKSGSQAANALQAIYTRMFSQAKKAIQEIGQVPIFLTQGRPTFFPTNIYREASDVIEDLAASWSTLTEAQKINLATQIGSRRQAAPTMALFENYNRAISAQIEAYKSAGEAIRDWGIKQESATVKLKQMQASWAQMISTVGDTSVWKGLLTVLDNVAITIAKMISLTKGLEIEMRRFNETQLMIAQASLQEYEGLKNLSALRDKYQKRLAEATLPAAKERYTSMLKEIEEAMGGARYEPSILEERRRKFIEEQVNLEKTSEQVLLKMAKKPRVSLFKVAFLPTSKEALEVKKVQDELIKQYGSLENAQKAITQNIQDEINKRVFKIGLSEKDANLEKKRYDELEKLSQLQDTIDTTAKDELQLLQHRATIMRNLGADEQEILKYMIAQWETNKKLEQSSEAQLEKRKLIYQLLENESKLVGEYSAKLESAFADTFKNLLLAEDSITNIFNNLTNNVRNMFATTLGEALSEGLMNVTGLADFFGLGMAGIKRMFSSPIKQAGGILEDSIVTGAQRAAPILSAAMVMGGTIPPGGGAGGVSGVAGFGGTMGSILPFLNQPVTPGKKYPVAGGGYVGDPSKPGALGSMTWGNLLGGVTMGAMVGYSAYQSMSARGVNKGYAGAAGGLQGVGSGLTMLGMGSGQFWLAGIGMLMQGVGSIMQMSAKGGTTTQIQEQTRTETKQVTSKIEITNKQLELVNRNLVAMREDLSYVMQSSYYFRERNTADRFAIDSMRGNM